MAIMQPYDAVGFAAYLLRSLGHTATAMGWNVVGDLEEVVNDTLLALGIEDISTVTTNADLRRLRVVGQLYLWRHVQASVAGDYTFSADGGSYSRDQVFAHAQQMLAQAESAAAAIGALDTYAVDSVSVTHHRDPYADYDDELATYLDQWNEL